tara:strand:+ start:858 stop:1118 length:261 start_codon:yes stop_codon:yes gene_type:complete
MAKNVKEHFKITDREWSRLKPEVKIKKIQEYNEMKRNQTIERFKNKNEDFRSDLKTDQYGTKNIRKGKVRRTLEEAGYDIKRVRNK